MNRLLTCTALGLVLGLSPALAQDAADTQSPPALQDPAPQSEVAPSDQGEPSDPATPIPGDTTEMSPSQPDQGVPPSAEAPSEPAMPPAAEAPSSEPATPPSAEAPQSIEPAAPKSAEVGTGGSQFLTKQESSDYLASNLIGQSVYNNQDEVIGSISDLITDQSGKVIAVLIGHGGFLGMGQKDVALRFEDLRISREDGSNVKVVADLSQDVLASAPDFETLSEQQVTIGKSDREDIGGQSGTTDSY